MEDDRARVLDVDRRELRVGALARRQERLVEEAAERVGDVFRVKRRAVVEAHVGPQVCHKRRRVPGFEALGHFRHDLELVVEAYERRVEQLMDTLARLVAAHARVEIGRADRDADDDSRIVLRATLAAGGAEQRQRQQHQHSMARGAVGDLLHPAPGTRNPVGCHASASSLSAARSVSACKRCERVDVDLAQPFTQSFVGRHLEQPELLLRAFARGRAGDRRASASCQFVLFEAGEDLARAADHAGREAGESRHLDAVAAVRSPRHHLAQEDDLILPFAHQQMRIGDSRQRVGQVGELVVVRGEERLRPRLRARGEVLGHGPGDAEAIEGRRAPADLVEHDEAARRRGVEDARGLLHLHHERRLPARDVVGRADAGVDAVDDRQLGLPRRHEGAGLGHQAEQGRLSQVRALAAHVRPGDDEQLLRRAVERQIVGHERFAGHRLDDRVPALDDREVVAVVQVRLAVVAAGGAVGKRRQHVERGERVRGALQRRRVRRDLAPQRLEDRHFERDEVLVGMEHLLLVRLERRRDEPLATGNGLLADVVGRDRVQVRPARSRCSSRRRD